MKLLRRLDVRLLLSYLGVIAFSLAVMVITLQLLAPSEFETQVETIGQQYGFGRQTTSTTGYPADTTVGTSTPGTSLPGLDPTGPTSPTDPTTSPADSTTTTGHTGGTGSGPGSTGGGSGGPGGTGGGSGGPGPGGGDAAVPVPIEPTAQRLAGLILASLGGETVGTDGSLAQPGPRGPGGSGTATIVVDLENAFDDALSAGLWAAIVASVVLATGLAALSSRRILRPLRDVQSAAGRMAQGRYDERIPVPKETELASLAMDVNALGDALARTEQQRYRLMSDLAHELRTPLTTIQGYMEGLIDGVFEPTPEVFSEVADEATRLKRLTADLSLLSRAEEGALVLNLEPIDLGTVAAQAAERLRPQFLDMEVELSIGEMPTMPVSGDPDRLAQVFTNVVGNALVHTPEGGRVWLTGANHDGRCEVAAHDTGSGISEDELAQIFDRFHRVEGEASVYAGTGIGLTISRTIVRSHGGELVAESAGTGRGATFRISLPERTG